LSSLGLGLDGVNLQIGDNLERALQDIRSYDTPITLWIDALCINQKDSVEKSHQVQLMRAVYSQATTVRTWIDQDIDPSVGIFSRSARPAVETNSYDWLPMAAVFRDAYWTRLWVQQEIILAGKHVIHFRANQLEAEPFLDFTQLMAKAFNNKRATHADLILLEPQMRILLNNDTFSGWQFLGRNYRHCRAILTSGLSTLPTPMMNSTHFGSLMGLYMDSGYLNVTDPRDRVYGVLGIAMDCGPEDIPVDYSLPLIQVYGQVFQHFIGIYRNLSFLCCAAIDPFEPGEPCTWLPQPRVRGSSFDLLVHTQGAGGAVAVAATRIRPLGLGLTITVRGVLIDRVKRTGLHRILHLAPNGGWYDDLRSLYLGTLSHTTMDTHWDSLVSAQYIRTVQTKQEEESLGPVTIERLYSQYCRKTKGTRLSLMGMLGDKSEQGNISREEERVLNQFLVCFAYAQFVTTEHGRPGIATSGDLAPGTELWIVFGCPMVLALEKSLDGHYALKGQVWLDGLMSGEACEGISLTGEPALDYVGPPVTEIILH
jgi:hypothetical protein